MSHESRYCIELNKLLETSRQQSLGNIDTNSNQKKSRYEMHKYWGKKPSKDLKFLIERYTSNGDKVLDPFAGYGVFCAEAYILNRDVISNDLNPIANFINNQLFEENVDLELLKNQWNIIKAEFKPFNLKWYQYIYDGQPVELLTVLRDKNGIPIKYKFKLESCNKCQEIKVPEEEAIQYLRFEEQQEIKDWFPKTRLIQNSRISAKNEMKVSDLFTKRTLACHSKLLSLIEKHSAGKEKDLFKVAFTSNLANCSKLVPPIKSRGEMSPGAWMTGFYIGERYLENNVLHYFENRLRKVIKGKLDYLNQLQIFNDKKYSVHYKILQNDAKNLQIDSESIDYVFTDPPYGDSVPYFEQSVIWNSWLQLNPDYDNEIVISDSKERMKNEEIFEKEIDIAFAEIRRVLKPNKYFSLTYHSLSGNEWKAITNACIKNGFELIDYKWLVQKSFTPRQINRLKSIKGDVLITLKKTSIPQTLDYKSDKEMTKLLKKQMQEWIAGGDCSTNEIFLRTMEKIFSEKILIKDFDLLEMLTNNYTLSDNRQWH